MDKNLLLLTDPSKDRMNVVSIFPGSKIIKTFKTHRIEDSENGSSTSVHSAIIVITMIDNDF